MAPRIYPSQQDTNLTAKGSLILSIDDTVDDVNVYVNDNLVNKNYSIVNGLYSVSINVNDVVRLERGEIIKISSTRKDYTTDDTAGNNGIVNTFITGITSTNSYTFTATTNPSSYNFEYLISVSLGGARATLIYKYNPSIYNNIGAEIRIQTHNVYGFPVTGGTQYFFFGLSPTQFTGTTSYTYNLGEVPIPQPTNAPITAYVAISACKINANGDIFQGEPPSTFKVYVNSVLVATSTYNITDPCWGLVTICESELCYADVENTFTCNDGDIIEYVFDDNFYIQPFPAPTQTPTPTPVPFTGYTPGSYILVDDSVASYPGTGTTWTSISTGTTYNGTLTNGPVWSGGTPGYFTFDGTNDWVDFGAASTGSTSGSFTWGGWVKTTTSATQKVFMLRGNDASGDGWSLEISKDINNKFDAAVVATTPFWTNITAKSTTTMLNDTWYYVIGVWTPGVRVRIYVNGVLETTTATTRTNLRTSGFGWNLMRNNVGGYTDGSISEFVVYPSVLTGPQIGNNFNANKSKYGY